MNNENELMQIYFKAYNSEEIRLDRIKLDKLLREKARDKFSNDEDAQDDYYIESLEWLNNYDDQQNKAVEKELEGKELIGKEEPKKINLKTKLKNMKAFDYGHNDLGTSELFANVYKDEFRYNVSWKCWAHYNGKIWAKDIGDMEVHNAMKKFARAMINYSLDYSNLKGGNNDDYIKYCGGLVNANKRITLINDSRSVYSFDSLGMDTDDYMLNTQNCVLKFHRDGSVEKIEHSSELMLSKLSNAIYDQDAKLPRWEQFINEIMQGDEEKIKYLQKLFGLCLTGCTQAEKFYVFHGVTTRNGKSTLCETIMYLLGDYGTTINPESLAIKVNSDSRQASPDKAKLKGVRMVVASEPKQSMNLDVGLIKSLTGGDTIVGRFLGENEIEFKGKFKLILNCNHAPIVSDRTLFTSDRCQIVSFNRHFEPNEQDGNLKDLFRQEKSISAILNWCIEGWKLYCKEGLKTPSTMQKDIDAYALQNDKLGMFLSETVEQKANAKLPCKRLYEAYTSWCDSNGHLAESFKNFQNNLRERRFVIKDIEKLNGVTTRNVIYGFQFIEDTEIVEPQETPYYQEKLG